MVIPGGERWVQQQARDAVNAALLEFLETLERDCSILIDGPARRSGPTAGARNRLRSRV
jgi:hypothetical protein